MVNTALREPRVGSDVLSRTATVTGACMSDPRRPTSHETENENQRPGRDGQPPRPATEPSGSEGSSNPGDTATDPATGKPNP